MRNPVFFFSWAPESIRLAWPLRGVRSAQISLSCGSGPRPITNIRIPESNLAKESSSWLQVTALGATSATVTAQLC